ncbi:cell wall-binding repeat-containing protein [Peptostreptococcus equinus]|uniref:Cell wall-binding repeat-containing protein n=1 Tax=Peptostreptococcus equinus TaxID=3003601 RepID=A0ABY7JQE7_9FIRM|nr:cell wall-binding repeat-containing protein [Peptostreptococcus sp. CBA3647]WAW14731.1 cell wall-binding repeat-containing protein [Peptostreptococcus sp. CBA3647]
MEISKKSYSKSNKVILVSGEKYPDALAASPLSVKYSAPLILLKKNDIPYSVANELKRLEAKEVIIVGGEEAISNKVANKLKENYAVDRIAGDNKYETSIQVSKRVNENKKLKAILVNGNKFPDALSASALAAKISNTIILTNGKTLLPSHLDVLDTKLNNIVVGGESVMSIKDLNATQIGGKDRYSTSISLAEKYFKDSKSVILATGNDYADALSAISLQEESRMPILLTESKSLNSDVEKYLRDTNVSKVYVVGGEKSVSSSVINSLKNISIQDENKDQENTSKNIPKSITLTFKYDNDTIKESKIDYKENKNVYDIDMTKYTDEEKNKFKQAKLDSVIYETYDGFKVDVTELFIRDDSDKKIQYSINHGENDQWDISNVYINFNLF